MEFYVLNNVVHSLPKVLQEAKDLSAVCNRLLLQVRTLIVNRAPSARVLVELISPLAKLSCGLIKLSEIDQHLEPAISRLALKITVTPKLVSKALFVAKLHSD